MSAGEQMTSKIPPTGLSWARAVVKPDHLWALTTLGVRSVLIAGRAGGWWWPSRMSRGPVV